MLPTIHATVSPPFFALRLYPYIFYFLQMSDLLLLFLLPFQPYLFLLWPDLQNFFKIIRPYFFYFFFVCATFSSLFLGLHVFVCCSIFAKYFGIVNFVLKLQFYWYVWFFTHLNHLIRTSTFLSLYLLLYHSSLLFPFFSPIVFLSPSLT